MTTVISNTLPSNELPSNPLEMKFEKLREELETAYKATEVYRNQVPLVKQEVDLLMQPYNPPTLEKLSYLSRPINSALFKEILLEKDTDKELMENCGVSWIDSIEPTINPHPYLKRAKLLSGFTVRPHPDFRSHRINIISNSKGVPLATYDFEYGSGFKQLSVTEAREIKELWKFDDLSEAVKQYLNRITFYDEEAAYKVDTPSNKLLLFSEQNSTFKDKVNDLLILKSFK